MYDLEGYAEPFGRDGRILISEVGPTHANRRHGTRYQHGSQQFISARPEYLQPKAKQYERGQPYGDVGAPLAEKPLEAIRIGIAKQDCQGNYGDGKEASQDKYYPVRRVGNRRLGQPNADDDGDRAWSGSQWQGQRIECLIEQTGLRGSVHRSFQFLVTSFIEKIPP